MHYIWPAEHAYAVNDLELERLYGYPGEPKWLVVNYVSSVDGAVEIDHRSARLSNAADRRVYELGSDLADVVLLGAGTAVVEDFRGVHPSAQTAERRRRHGLADVPPIAVVTTGKTLPVNARVITEALTPTIVITTANTPETTQASWTDAGAKVLIAGSDTVDLAAAVETLTQQGMSRIDCEGGPQLFGSLLEAGLVDELRLTMSPLLVSGAAGRIAMGVSIEPTAVELTSALADEDTLLLRYLVKR